MKRVRRRPARSASNPSSASVTSMIVACSSESAHRSSTGRAGGSAVGVRPGAQPAAFAYRTKNDAVFQ